MNLLIQAPVGGGNWIRIETLMPMTRQQLAKLKQYLDLYDEILRDDPPQRTMAGADEPDGPIRDDERSIP